MTHFRHTIFSFVRLIEFSLPHFTHTHKISEKKAKCTHDGLLQLLYFAIFLISLLCQSNEVICCCDDVMEKKRAMRSYNKYRKMKSKKNIRIRAEKGTISGRVVVVSGAEKRIVWLVLKQ